MIKDFCFEKDITKTQRPGRGHRANEEAAIVVEPRKEMPMHKTLEEEEEEEEDVVVTRADMFP